MDKIFNGIGLMSGTSLDGLDIVSVRFTENNGWKYEVQKAMTVPYNDEWKRKLSTAENLMGVDLVAIDLALGDWMGQQIAAFIKKHRLTPSFIASHGHTIFHQPKLKLTLQIGNANSIHKHTETPIVYDFRSLDVIRGGQGAPLVPAGDHHLFGEYDACLNLGGIANISLIKNAKRIAFDIVPVNIVLNYLSQKLGKTYDDKGNMASKGTVCSPLLKKLNTLKYYQQIGSKSLGKEWIIKHIIPLLQLEELTPEDSLATLNEHIAMQIASILPKGNVLVTGGGAYNTHLINCIIKHTGPNTQLVIPDKETIEFKEAIIFAFLGLLRLQNEVNCFASVTGANTDSCTGSIIGNIKLQN